MIGLSVFMISFPLLNSFSKFLFFANKIVFIENLLSFIDNYLYYTLYFSLSTHFYRFRYFCLKIKNKNQSKRNLNWI